VPKANKMDKVLPFPRPEEGLSDVGSSTLNRADRTFMCTVLFLDIVEYAKKPVSQQLRVKQHFNARLSEALRDIAANDRIILDTGDGAAINFLGDPEDALFVAMSLAQAFAQPPEDGGPAVVVRIGINLGPVRLVTDINGQPNIIGDGINVAERVMSFAGSGQVLVSRAYFEVVTRISEDYMQVFAYQGSRTDKHVREHEIYAVASSGTEAINVAERWQRARPSRPPAVVLVDTAPAGVPARPWLRRIKLPYAAAAVSAVALMCALVYYVADRALVQPSDSAKFSPAIRIAERPAQPGAPTRAEAPPHEAKTVEPSEPALPAPKPTAVDRHTARKSVNAPKHAAAETPAALPVATKTNTAEPIRPVPSVTPWRTTREEQKAMAAVSSAGTDAAAASPYTAAAPKGASALVQLAVSPWGEVIVDGKSVGVSPPLADLELAPGTHRVEIRNGDFTPHQVTLQLESNQTIKIKHKFTQR
jgi:class 3 adenylate cyclase